MFSNPWIVLAIVLSHLGVAIASFGFGRSHEAGEQAKEQNAQALAYAGEIVKQQGQIDGLAGDLEAARTAQRPKDRIITKEVIRYETVTPADRRCDLPGSWRVLHDAAATGEPPPAVAPGVSDGGAEGVSDAAALETVADNYTDCRRFAEQVRGWQSYYRTVTGEIRAQARPGE